MKNIPLVFLGVIFSAGFYFLLAGFDGKTLAAIFAAVALVSTTIDYYQTSARKKLDDILQIKTLSGEKLRAISRKVELWKSILDHHTLLSIVLKILLAILAAFLVASSSGTGPAFWEIVISLSATFGCVALLFQSVFYFKYIERCHDAESVDARHAADGKAAAELLLGPYESRRDTPPPAVSGYREVVFKF